MPKLRSGKKGPTEADRAAALEETVKQLEQLDSDALSLVCERLNIEESNQLTDVGCVEAIKGVHRWDYALKRMLGTKKFFEQLDLWKNMKERGIQPVTLKRMGTLWLWDFELDSETDHLRVLCAYVGLETSGTHLELIERLEVVPGINKYKSVLQTPLWHARIANAATFLASNPPKTSLKHLWLQKLTTDELKLMCKSLGIDIDGDHFKLFARLDAVTDIDRYHGYLKSDWWWREISNHEKLQKKFEEYKPDRENEKQLAYSHIPTTEPVRQQWLGCAPTYAVSGIGNSLTADASAVSKEDDNQVSK